MSEPVKSHSSNLFFNGAFYTLTTRLGIKFLGLVSSIILARMLTPADFGLIAVAMAVYAFIELFGAVGFGTALIQRQNTTAEEYNTAWTFKFIFGTCSAIIIFLIAEPSAVYFSDMRLVNVLRTISLMAFISGLTNIGVIDFQKNFQFHKELKFLLIPKFFSAVFTITAVMVLKSYWALVLGMFFSQILFLILSYKMHPFRPRFALGAFNVLFKFSKWILFSNILLFINNKISEVIIGKRLSLSDAGLFNIANEFASIPTTEIAAPINKASYPVYAKLQNDSVGLKNAYLETLLLTACLTLPAAVGIYSVAPVFVKAVLGEQWVAATTVLQLIAISGVFSSVTNNIGYIFLAKGKPRTNFYINLAKTLIYVPSLLLLLPLYGINGAGYAALITSALLVLAVQTIATLTLGISIRELLKQLYRPVFSVLIMYYSIALLPVITHQLLALFVAILTGFITFICTLTLLTCINPSPTDPVYKAIKFTTRKFNYLWQKKM